MDELVFLNRFLFLFLDFWVFQKINKLSLYTNREVLDNYI